jgi:ABC-type branched-subunit amino acid transport system ATPase component
MNASEAAPVLTVEHLTVSFGAVHALSDVSYSINPGEVVGLIGPNGAGKTTFIDAVTGFVRATGAVKLNGTDISKLPAYRRVRRGLTRTFQSMELFQDLTVRQNLLVAAENSPGADKSSSEMVDFAINSMRLDDVADLLPGGLPLGRQKLVAVGRALASGARVLLLDEPAAGLDSDESLEFANHLRGAIETGVSVLLIDHDLDLVMRACDRIFVLSFGSIIAEGTPDQISADPAVRAAYIGIDDEDETE